jgi:hypothetical protein
MSSIGEDVVAWVGQAKKEVSQMPTHYRYEFFIEDDSLQPRETAMAVRRLVGWNKVNVLLTYGSAPGAAAATYASSVHIPHIAVAYDTRATAGDYSVSFLTPVSAQMPKFLEMLEKKGYRRLAVFAVRNATWQPVVDELHLLDKEGKIKITYEKIYAPGERDFRLGLQFMPLDQVDAMLLLSWSPEVNIMARQAREQKVSKPIIGFGGSLVLSDDRPWFDGDLDVFFGDFTEANKLNFKLTGHSVVGSAGPLTYDRILMMVDIYERLSKEISTPLPTNDQVMTAIKSTKEFRGLLGVSVYHKDKFFHLPTNIYRIEKGDFRMIKLEDL